MVSDLCMLWQQSQTRALGANTNLLHDCLLLITSTEHSVEVHVVGKARHLTLRLCHRPHWIVLCVSIPVLVLMRCWLILLRMTILLLSFSGKQEMPMHSKRLKVLSATRWLVSGMAAPSWLITGSAQQPPARRPRRGRSYGWLLSRISEKTSGSAGQDCAQTFPADLRELQSAVLTTLIANRDSDLTSAATSATQGHNTRASDLCKARKNGELESLGEPHVHLWGGVVAYVSENGKISEDEKQVLQQHLHDSEPQKLEETVFVAKCKQCYDPKKMRFVFYTAQQVEPILKIVIGAMVAEGAVLKRGVAPRSGNDRESQTLLDGLVEDA